LHIRAASRRWARLKPLLNEGFFVQAISRQDVVAQAFGYVVDWQMPERRSAEAAAPGKPGPGSRIEEAAVKLHAQTRAELERRIEQAWR
jgi:hypothetical protein